MKNGCYRLHSAFDRVLNYLNADMDLVSLVTPGIGLGPGRVICDQLPRPPPETIEVSSSDILVGTERIKRARLPPYDPRLELMATPSAADLSRRIQLLLTLLPKAHLTALLDANVTRDATSPGGTPSEQLFFNAMATGIDQLMKEDYSGGARSLKGLGYGLTPSGDDVLCGFMYALSCRTPKPQDVLDAILHASLGNNPLSNHFLRCAHDGHYFQPFKSFAWLSAPDRMIHCPRRLSPCL